MKQLKFDHRFAQLIKSGDKTATFRVNDDKDIQVGDRVELIDKVVLDNPTSWVIPGEIKINSISQVSLNSMKSSDFLLGEKFHSKEDMVLVFRRFYGEYITIDSLITILQFDYWAFDHPRKFLDNTNGDSLRLPRAKLFADGGSRGNPGPSALGFIVQDTTGKVVHADNKYLGVTTNNQAEYHALIAGMRWCKSRQVAHLEVFLDSMLVVNQLKGIFKVKNRELWSLYETARELREKFSSISITHIPRELNKLADTEVNKALDALKGSDIVQ